MINNDNLQKTEYVGKIIPENTKNSVIKSIQQYLNINTEKFDRTKFISEYYGFLLKKFKLPFIKLYFEELKNRDNKTIALAHAASGNKIYLNQEILTKENRFFYDLFIMTHEFCHLLVDKKNNEIVRKVGKNSHEYMFGFYKENIQNLNIDDTAVDYFIYFANITETTCDNFGYEFVIDLMEEALSKFKEQSVDLFLFNENLKKMKELYKTRQETLLQINNTLMPTVTLDTAIMQEKALYEFKSYVNFIIKHKVKVELAHLEKLTDLQTKIFISFSINKNFEVLNELKDFCYLNSGKMQSLFYFYTNCLNHPGYTVTKQDIEKMLTIVDIRNERLMFSDLKLDEESLKKTIIEIKFKKFDKNFEKSYFNTFLVTKDSHSLCEVYKAYLLSKEKEKEKNKNDEKTK